MPLSRPTLPPPRPEPRPVVSRHHGHDLVDPYAWLRAPDWHDAIDDAARLPADIKAHLDAERAYASEVLASTATLRSRLVEEMTGLIAPEDSTVPERDGPWAYFERFAHGADHHCLCREPAGGGPDQVLLDCDALAHGKPFWSLQEAIPSPDHRLLAYAFDPTGSERCTIRIRDLATGRNLPDRISGASGDIAWSSDSTTLLYVKLDRLQRPMEVWRHRLGTPAAQDVLVWREPDPVFEVGVGVTQSGDYVLIETHAHDSSEIWLLPAATPDAAPRCIAPRRPGHAYAADHFAGPDGDRVVVTTNSAGAVDFRICTVPVAGLGEAAWTEVVPHREGCRIVDTVSYARHLVRLEREDGQPRIVVRRWADGAEHAIAFDEDAIDLQLEPGLAFDTDSVRFVLSSLTTPERVFDYDLETRARTLRKEAHIPRGHDPADYVGHRLHARARDGAEVPVSVLHHRSTPLDGSAPLMLIAYGAYGVALDAAFDALRLPLVDRGFVIAIAHVRGGDDKGEAWYAGGRHRDKRNTFTDFIAVAEHLIAAGFTRRGRIVAKGESAGGMLVGAVLNMAPGLLCGAIADVPFVDVLDTMLDADLPMTPGEWSEWGNPIDDARDFELIRSWCPYQNVARQPYPPILANASLADLRVAYWEPAKWVARLRELGTGDAPVVLNLNDAAGHEGTSGRFARLEEIAVMQAFALAVAGLDEAVPHAPGKGRSGGGRAGA